MSGKVKPAPIFEKKRGKYRLHFCYGSKQYRRYLISDKKIANLLQSKVNTRILEFKRGLLSRPAHVSLPDFIFPDLGPKEEAFEAPPISVLTLSDLMEEYHRISAPPVKARSTHSTDTIHLNHLRKFMEQKGLSGILLNQVTVGFLSTPYFSIHRLTATALATEFFQEIGPLQA